MVKIVIELGDWMLVEDEDGETRVWHNRSTNETRGYDDMPDEVAEQMASDISAREEKAAPSDGLAADATMKPAPSALEAPTAAAPAVPFSRQRGLAANASANAGAALVGARGGDVAAQAAALGAVTGSETITPRAAAAPLQQVSNMRVADDDLPVGLPWSSDPSDPNGEWGGDPSADLPVGRPWNGDPPLERTAEPIIEPVLQMPKDLKDAPTREPSIGMLAKATSVRANSGESPEQLLRRITHLHLASKNLTVFGTTAINACMQVQVLYLTDNMLHTIAPLHRSIKQLHLQGNDIWETSSWSLDLPQLELLDLRENRLTVVTGFHKSMGLRELKLRGQRSGGLSFSDNFLRTTATSVQVLDVARNRLTDVACYQAFRRLQQWDVSENVISYIDPLAPALSSMPMLRSMHLTGNPLCRAVPKYRDEVILLTRNLDSLDGKEVLQHERAFLNELEKRRRKAGGRGSRSRGPSAPPEMRGAQNAQGPRSSANSPSGAGGQSAAASKRSVSEGRRAHSSTPPASGQNAGRQAAARRPKPDSGYGGQPPKLPPLPSGPNSASAVAARIQEGLPGRQRSFDRLS